MKRTQLLNIGIWLLGAVLGLGLWGLDAFAANDAVIGQGARVELSNPSMTIFLATGGQVDSLTVNPSSFSFVMSVNSSLTATSTTAISYTVDPSNLVTSSSCSQSAGSQVTLSKTTTGTQEVTITIGASCVSTSGGGGGGGGGSATASPTTTTTTTATPSTTTTTTTTTAPTPTTTTTTTTETPTAQSITAKIAEIQAKIAALTGATPPGAEVVAKTPAKDVAFGQRGDDVKSLQALLARDKEVYPDGLMTGYFGSLTRAAVVRFQKKYGLPQVGRVGPMTRAKLKEVFESGAPAPTPALAPAPAPSDNSAQIQAIQAQIKAIQDKIKALQGQ